MKDVATQSTVATFEMPVETGGRKPQGQYKALSALCLGYFMVILDTTVVNVALPDIQRQLGASFSSLQWVIDGYALIFASLLLTGGAIADRLGGRRTYLTGFALFTAASALCGAAPSIWLLLIARAAQGVGGALLVPASLALLRATFPSTSRRATAVGIWAATAGVAAGGGPVVGGLLIGLLGWRSAFMVNVPVGLLGLVLTVRYVHASAQQQRDRLDLLGPIASVAALGGFTYAIIEGGAHGWSSRAALAGFGVALIGATLLVVAERSGTDPMLPRGLFTVPGFSAATAVGFLLNFGFYGQLFLLSLYFQEVRGLSPVATGLALLPETGMALIANLISGRMTARLGPRLPLALGLALAGAGLLALVPATGSPAYAVLAGVLVVVGFGAALAVPAVTASILELAPGQQAGISAAVLNASRQMGGVLGVALLGALASGVGSALPGLHQTLIVAGGAMLLACVIALLSSRPLVEVN